MRPIAVFLSLFVVFAFPPAAHLQEVPATPQRDPQAVAALGQAIAALGGAGAGVVNDVTLTGTARRIAGSDVETGTGILKALRTGEASIELSFSSGRRTVVRANSAKGAIANFTGADGVARRVPSHNLAVDGRWFFPALVLSTLSSSPKSSLKDAGVEMFNGRSARHLIAMDAQIPAGIPASGAKLLQHLSQIELYLDPSTGLPVALTFYTHPDNDSDKDFPVEIRFSDYRIVNGLQTPFHVQHFFNKGLSLDLEFDSVVLNTGLSASSFDVKEVKQ